MNKFAFIFLLIEVTSRTLCATPIVATEACFSESRIIDSIDSLFISAELGDKSAIPIFAENLRQTEGNEPLFVTSYWGMQASNQGDLSWTSYLWRSISEGYVASKNPKLARNILVLGVSHADPKSELEASSQLCAGKTKEENATGLSLLNDAAEQGLPEGQFYLGMALRNGNCGIKSEQQGTLWLEQAFRTASHEIRIQILTTLINANTDENTLSVMRVETQTVLDEEKAKSGADLGDYELSLGVIYAQSWTQNLASLDLLRGDYHLFRAALAGLTGLKSLISGRDIKSGFFSILKFHVIFTGLAFLFVVVPLSLTPVILLGIFVVFEKFVPIPKSVSGWTKKTGNSYFAVFDRTYGLVPTFLLHFFLELKHEYFQTAPSSFGHYPQKQDGKPLSATRALVLVDAVKPSNETRRN